MEFLDSDSGSKLNGSKDRRSEGKDRGSRRTRRTFIALLGRGNRFKSSRNTRIPSVEFMVAMAELLSPKIIARTRMLRLMVQDLRQVAISVLKARYVILTF